MKKLALILVFILSLCEYVTAQAKNDTTYFLAIGKIQGKFAYTEWPDTMTLRVNEPDTMPGYFPYQILEKRHFPIGDTSSNIFQVKVRYVLGDTVETKFIRDSAIIEKRLMTEYTPPQYKHTRMIMRIDSINEMDTLKVVKSHELDFCLKTEMTYNEFLNFLNSNIEFRNTKRALRASNLQLYFESSFDCGWIGIDKGIPNKTMRSRDCEFMKEEYQISDKQMYMKLGSLINGGFVVLNIFRAENDINVSARGILITIKN